LIYADNAATTALDLKAFKAMKPYLLTEYGNASQPYSFSRTAKEALKQAREIIAACINAEPEEIYFTSGGTESDNWAIKGTTLVCKDNCRTITSMIEHKAVLNTCSSIEKQGHTVIYLPVTTKGVVEPETLQKYITSDTKLVSIMYVNNEIGTIEPIEDLCKIAHQYGALFHTDAVQAVGHMPIDVNELGVDMLSASAHKFNGPKGIGFLYIRKGTKISPFNDGGSQEQGLRAGTENIAGIVGMAYALKANYDLLERNIIHIRLLEKVLKRKLRRANIDFIRNGVNQLPGNISLSFRNIDGEMLMHRLDFKGICVSTGSACDSQNTKTTHVIEAINVPDDYKFGTIRISFGRGNTMGDVLKIAEALVSIIKSCNTTIPPPKRRGASW